MIQRSFKKDICRWALIGTVFIFFQATVYAGDLIRIGGSGGGLSTIKVLAAANEKKHPGTRVEVFPSLGSSGGIKALVNGALDIAISGRPLKDAEREKGASAVEYAKTPFIFISSPGVKTAGLNIRELEQIYSRQVQSWPDGSNIRLVLRPAGESDNSVLKGISPSMEKGVLSALSREGMLFAITDQESVETVENTPGSLGTSTLGQVVTEKRKVKVLSFNGVNPTAKAIADGSYHLHKSFYAVTTPKAAEAALQFIKFLFSKEGREILTDSGYLVK